MEQTKKNNFTKKFLFVKFLVNNDLMIIEHKKICEKYTTRYPFGQIDLRAFLSSPESGE